MRKTKQTNLVVLLESRRVNNGSNFRISSKIVRKLVCKTDTKFVKVWQKRSKHPIAFENGRLFLDNYRTSYSLNGVGFKPGLTYKLSARPSNQRIEEATLASFPLETLPLERNGWKPCLLAVSLDNYLTRYDLDTGQTLEKVFLSSIYKFRHLTWNNLGYSIVLKSVHVKCPVPRRQLTQAGQEAPTVLLAFALFDMYPLRFVGLVEITKKIFGKDIIDADITEGMLIIMHQNNLLKVYSWEHIMLKSVKYQVLLGENCCQLDGGIVGCKPAGLPLNITISECPAVLFEVKCQNHNLSFGGIPWHYIMCPPGRLGQFHVYSVADNTLAGNGQLSMGNTSSIEPDRCLFHFDESSRIIHMGADEVKIFRLTETQNSEAALTEEFSVSSEKLKPKLKTSQELTTASGRRIKNMRSFEDTSLETIQDIQYEDDLDLLLVTAIHTDGENMFGTVYIHDSKTGELYKEVPLDEPWKPFCRHTVMLDMNNIIHIADAGNERTFDCSIYQLDLRPEEKSPRKFSERLRAKNTDSSESGRRRRGRRRRRTANDDSDEDYA